MSQKVYPGLGVLLLLLLLAATIFPQETDVGLIGIPGQMVVRVKSEGQISSLVRRYDVTLIDSVEDGRTFLVQIPPGKDFDSAADGITRSPLVESAHGNFLVSFPETFQISQGFPDQRAPIYAFAESPVDYFTQPGTYSTGIDSAHQIATGSGVVVAVIDNGLVFDHPILQDMQTVEGRDLLDDDNDPSETMEGLYVGHGTFVTSLVWLTAPDCQIMPIKAFDGNGVGDVFSLIQAIHWAKSHGANVINLSCGVDVNSPILRSAIQAALSSGVVMVSAAGNSGDSTYYYPAAYDGVIGVTAIDENEMRADFACYGSFVDLVAPGVDVYGALPGETDWGTWSGTSFSSPLVAGTAALVLQLNPEMLPGQVQNHLRASARIDLLWGTVNAPDSEYGYGALNALNAVVGLAVGDMDLSGQRNVVDLELLADYVNNRLPGACESVIDMIADVNCDGVVDAQDTEAMAQFFNGNRRKWQPCYH
ncbi:MAG TPA: S8 family serine peptidase [candidate division Zixibacteria bacterium]|nr:S8 family serine peptidase [candidate division Zixibacteria bacterium]